MMVDDLLKLRDICDEAVAHGNHDFYLSPDVWIGLTEIHKTLEPIFIATQQLQSQKITLTGVRKIIRVCWMRTAEIGE